MCAGAKREMGLTQEALKSQLEYNPDDGHFTRKTSFFRTRVGERAGSIDEMGYVKISVNNVRHRAHRLVWLYMTGSWPSEQIDHINRCRSDNRFANLRDVTSADNRRNSGLRIDNSSGVKGVYWSDRDKTWSAEIKIHGKKHRLGTYKEKEEAISARVSAEERFSKTVTVGYR